MGKEGGGEGLRGEKQLIIPLALMNISLAARNTESTLASWYISKVINFATGVIFHLQNNEAKDLIMQA